MNCSLSFFCFLPLFFPLSLRSSVFRSLSDCSFFHLLLQQQRHTATFFLCSVCCCRSLKLIFLLPSPLQHQVLFPRVCLHAPSCFLCFPRMCVYSKSWHQIDPVMFPRSITQRMSQFSRQTVMNDSYSPFTWRMLAFSFLFSLNRFSFTLRSHTVASISPWSEIWSDRLGLHLPVHR